MRVYVGLTLPALADMWAAGELTAPVAAHAVTPAVRESYAEGDAEELEYAALSAAALDSLRALAADPSAPRRRVVVAAETADDAATPTGAAKSAVTVAVGVRLRDVAAVHVDDESAADVVRAAVASVDAAAAGDDEAAWALDEAAGCELMWFATQEVPHLLV